MAKEESYDYLVLGGSPSGCVVAHEILNSRDDVTVCIVEAGSANPNVRMNQYRGLRGLTLGSSLYRWTYRNTPTKNYKRKVDLFAGKALGGATAVNGMIWVRPSREDIRQCLGSEFLEGYDQFEEIEEKLQARYPITHYYSKSVYESFARDTRFQYVESLNGVDSLHYKVGRHCVTCREDNRRVSAYDAYIKPLMNNPRLVLRPNTVVDRLLIDGKDVTGAVTVDGRHLHAKRQVILAAGGIQTPCVLMRSGYGPARHLRDLNIPVVVDNPHVGQHLLDHPHFDLFWLLPEICHIGDADSFMNTHYAVGDSWLAQTTNNGALVNFYELLLLKRYIPRILKHWSRGFWNRGLQAVMGNVFHLGISLAHPKSEGSVELATKDARLNPVVRLNYFDNPRDLSELIRGVQETYDAVRELDFIECGTPLFNLQNLEQEIRRQTGTHWHYACTARMGDVVDSQFRLLGLNNLVIADVSVLRQLPTVNTQSIAYFVGKMVADALLGCGVSNASPVSDSSQT